LAIAPGQGYPYSGEIDISPQQISPEAVKALLKTEEGKAFLIALVAAIVLIAIHEELF
jgi:hypothetical protein